MVWSQGNGLGMIQVFYIYCALYFYFVAIPESPGFNPWVGKMPWRRERLPHSSILAWRIPWTILSMGSLRVRHDWVTFASLSLSGCSALTLGLGSPLLWESNATAGLAGGGIQQSCKWWLALSTDEACLPAALFLLCGLVSRRLGTAALEEIEIFVQKHFL